MLVGFLSPPAVLFLDFLTLIPSITAEHWLASLKADGVCVT